MKIFLFFLPVIFLATFTSCSPVKVLIVDGQNNHVVWPKLT